MPDRYPLAWPLGVPRTPRPEQSRFDRRRSFEQARRELYHELKLLGAKGVTLSTSLELRLDGDPYSNRRQPEDKGVAVYFELKGINVCFPCDRWNRIECNCYAIAKHIEAMRSAFKLAEKNNVRSLAFIERQARGMPEKASNR